MPDATEDEAVAAPPASDLEPSGAAVNHELSLDHSPEPKLQSASSSPSPIIALSSLPTVAEQPRALPPPLSPVACDEEDTVYDLDGNYIFSRVDFDTPENFDQALMEFRALLNEQARLNEEHLIECKKRRDAQALQVKRRAALIERETKLMEQLNFLLHDSHNVRLKHSDREGAPAVLQWRTSPASPWEDVQLASVQEEGDINVEATPGHEDQHQGEVISQGASVNRGNVTADTAPGSSPPLVTKSSTFSGASLSRKRSADSDKTLEEPPRQRPKLDTQQPRVIYLVIPDLTFQSSNVKPSATTYVSAFWHALQLHCANILT